MNIANVMLWMMKNAYEQTTIKKVGKLLRHLERNCNTSNPEEVKFYIQKNNAQTDTSKVSLHATLNKRLRDLEKKGYLHRVDTKWHLGFKGILANLLIQPKPRMWNHQWKEIFDAKAKVVEDTSPTYLQKFGIKKENISGALKRMGLSLDDFKGWIGLTEIVKSLMEKGIINFDFIKDSTLLGLILIETKSIEELSNIWNPDPDN